jgi:hypothetical protein
MVDIGNDPKVMGLEIVFPRVPAFLGFCIDLGLWRCCFLEQKLPSAIIRRDLMAASEMGTIN